MTAALEAHEQLKRDFEIMRTACQQFERAANDWMDRALRAEGALMDLNAELDSFWGLRGHKQALRVCDAQLRCRKIVEANG